MKATLELESSLTDRYQTTVPDAVRQALKIVKHDKIRYFLQPDGTVLIARAPQKETADPILRSFLAFLAAETKAHPKNINAINFKWLQRIRSLVKNVEISLNQPLANEDE
jgi:antitoxin PrlF